MATPDKIHLEHVDQLRAGLLDNDPALASTVRSALESDGDLAAGDAIWNRVTGELEVSATGNQRLANQLRIRRRKVLSGKMKGQTRRRFTLPQMAIATATSVAITLGVVSLIGDRPSGADAPISQAVQTASDKPECGTTGPKTQTNAEKHPHPPVVSMLFRRLRRISSNWLLMESGNRFLRRI